MNTWTVSFDTTGVERPTASFELPPEGPYPAKIIAISLDAAKNSERSSEFNNVFTVALDDGETNYERKVWVPEPTCRSGNPTEKAKKAAKYGSQQLVAILMSLGVPREKLTGRFTLTEADLLNKRVYVNIVHEEAEKKRADGTPYVNAVIDSFITKEEFEAAKAGTPAGATARAVPAANGGVPAGGSSLQSILGTR